jgi:hypothetical protein
MLDSSEIKNLFYGRFYENAPLNAIQTVILLFSHIHEFVIHTFNQVGGREIIVPLGLVGDDEG